MVTANNGAQRLREIADAADATSREQHRAASTARRVAGARERGVSWAALTGNGSVRTLLDLLTGGATRLRDVAGGLRHLVAGGMAREGFTTRQIGNWFGVSHQRISSLLSREDNR